MVNLYLGCGPSPLHDQHKRIMGNPEEWIFVDRYVHESHIKNWDATTLEEVEDNTVDKIYSSHFLEHVSYVRLNSVLSLWYQKLKKGGELILNVPDLEWVCREVIRYAQGQPATSKYFNEFEGEHGLLAIIYGSHSHEGEYHKAGFIEPMFRKLLERNGFVSINIEKMYEAHSMGCILARCQK